MARKKDACTKRSATITANLIFDELQYQFVLVLRQKGDLTEAAGEQEYVPRPFLMGI